MALHVVVVDIELRHHRVRVVAATQRRTHSLLRAPYKSVIMMPSSLVALLNFCQEDMRACIRKEFCLSITGTMCSREVEPRMMRKKLRSSKLDPRSSFHG